MTPPAAALVRSLPSALGRTPADELLLVTWAEEFAAAAIYAVPLEYLHDEEAEHTATLVGAAVNGALRDGSQRAVVVVYADDGFPTDSTPGRFAALAVVTAEANGLAVLDAIAVTDGRWRSYDCTDPSCCPPEGTPITEGPTP